MVACPPVIIPADARRTRAGLPEVFTPAPRNLRGDLAASPAEGTPSGPACLPVGPWLGSHLRRRIRGQGAGGRELPAEGRLRLGARRERERADGGLPPPGRAAQGRGGQGRVAEGKEPEGRVKGGGAGGGRLRVAVQGGGQGRLIERGLDGGVAPRALQT